VSRTLTVSMVVLIASLTSGCGDGDDGSGGGASSGQDAGLDAQAETSDEPAVGPWECLPNNIARRKSDGDIVECGFLKCTVEDGCGNTALGCQSDEDCVSSTLEVGWTVDQPVHCDTDRHVCSPPPPQ